MKTQQGGHIPAALPVQLTLLPNSLGAALNFLERTGCGPYGILYNTSSGP